MLIKRDRLVGKSSASAGPATTKTLPLVLSLLSVLMIVLSYLSLLHHKSKVPDNCETPYMYESYATLNEFNSKYSRMGSKYSLKYYREGNGVDTDLVPKGIPVLFIPGNAGSYRQVRSLASYCSVKTKAYNSQNQNRNLKQKSLPNLDFFTADLNNDFTAFHGSTLLDQAEFLNDAIDYILGLYEADPTSKIPPPSSVIVIGHSMGGIVARTMLTLPNYVPDSINTILTLSTPHVMPPLSFDRDLVMIYERVNQYWREAFSESKSSRGALSNMALISITGGQSDDMVPSDLTDVSSLVHRDHGFTTFTYSIPGVWTGIDHLAIVWCVALRNIIGESLFSIVDVQSASKTKPLAERMALLRSKMLSPFDISALDTNESYQRAVKGLDPYTEYKKTTEIYPAGTELAVSSDVLALSKTKRIRIPKLGEKRDALHSIPLNSLELLDRQEPSTSTSTSSYIGILTNATSLQNVELLLCEKTKTPKIRANINILTGELPVTYLNCYNATNVVPAILPASFKTSKLPSDNYGKLNTNKFYYFNYKSDTSKEFTDFIVLDKSDRRENAFLEAEVVNMDYISVNASTLSFLNGRKIPLQPGLYNDVSLAIADNGLISYNVELTLDETDCKFDETNFFSPLVRQYLPQPLESKYHVNAANRVFTVNTHGPRTPYTPYSVPCFGNNLHFQVFLPPVMCRKKDSQGFASLTVSINLWASLSNIVLRYRTLLATLPLAVTLAIFLNQIETYNSCGSFPGFLESLYTFVFSQLLEWVLGTVALFVILGLEPVRKILRRFQLFYNSHQDSAMFSFDPHLKQNELFVGTSDLRFWFLGPMFLLIAVGLCAMIYLVLSNFILPVIVQPLRFLSYQTSFQPRGPGHFSKDKRGWSAHKLPLSKESVFQDYLYLATGVGLIGLLVLIPYQIMFLLLTCFQIFNTAQTYMLTRSGFTGDRNSCCNILNLKISLSLVFLWLSVINGPFLVVWIHSVTLKWSIAFSTWHNVVAILPFLVLIRQLRDNVEMIPQMTGSRQRLFNRLILWYSTLYALLFGVVSAYMMHHLICFVCLWLVLAFIGRPKFTKTPSSVTTGRLPTSNSKATSGF